MQAAGFQRRILISPRSFQLVCRYGTKRSSLLDRLLPRSTNSAASARKSEKSTLPAKTAKDDGIRWFEKDVETGTIKEVDGNPEEAEAREVMKRIGNISRRLRRYDADIDSEEFHETIIETFPEEQRPAVAAALKRKREEYAKAKASLEIALPQERMTQEGIVKSLNSHLVMAAEKPNDVATQKELWKWYKRAKRYILGVHTLLPTRAWHTIWQSLSVAFESGLGREERLLELASDMDVANISRTVEESEAMYEALLLTGRAQEAVKRWTINFEWADRKGKMNLEHGIKLFAAVGNFQKAIDLLRQYQKQERDADPRVIHPVIASCVQNGDENLGYTLYLSLKDRLGNAMQMKDYDLIVTRFLAHGFTDLALAVFRDMMIRGTDMVKKEKATLETEQAMMAGMLHRLKVIQNKSTNPQQINNVSLQALVSLPHQWQNKFFYASWIKKLIGMGNLDGAIKVIDLMYERRIQPDPIHMNGIVGALMRSDDSKRVELGESIAWTMIRRRIECRAKQQGYDGHIQGRIDQIEGTDSKVPIDLSRPTPPAKAETFNLLGLHYLLEQKWAHLRHLERCLEPAGIKMSSFFMNQLLYMQLHNNGPAPTWYDFLRYTETTRPDMDTFRALWQAQQRIHDTVNPAPAESFPNPRALFKTMITWRLSLRHKDARAAVADFDSEMYVRIISTFCVMKDFGGCIVVFNAIRKFFGAEASGGGVEAIVSALGNVYAPSVGRIRGLSTTVFRKPIAQDQMREDAVRKVLQKLVESRARSTSKEIRKRARRSRAAEDAYVLSQLVRVVLMRVHKDADAIEKSIAFAAEEMGVSGIRNGDITAHDLQ